MINLGVLIRNSSKCKQTLLLLGIGLSLALSGSVARSARIAGENGVIPSVTSTTDQKEPVKENASADAPENLKSVADENRSIQRASEKTSPEEGVNIDLDNVDITVFIKLISKWTGRNFVVDDAVKAKVTIISPTKISIHEAYKVFESVLEVHGFTAVPSGSITKIIPIAQANTKSIETMLRPEGITTEDNVVTQLIPLKYADPEEVKKLFTLLVSKNSVIVSYPPTGMLIITDVQSNIKRLLHIVDVIDVEGTGKELTVVPLEYARASVMEKSIEAVFQDEAARVPKGRTEETGIKIAADDRTNALIILASQVATLKIKKLITLLDKASPPGEGDIHVYYCQNANAEGLANVLMAIPTQQSGRDTRTVERQETPVISKSVGIVADKATNSLIITAKKEDYLILEDVIKKLDITRQMVYIEALIMEVSVSKDFEIGVQWTAAEETGSHDDRAIVAFGDSKPPTSILPTINTETGMVSVGNGLSLGLLGEAIQIGDISFPNIGAVIRAYESDSDVHILSKPQIKTTDNEEAEIHVGKNIPFLTSQERTQTAIDYSNYEYKDVGVTLKVTPQINQERFVRLKIEVEVSQVVEQEVLGLPTTLQRMAKTTVIAKDGNTVVIGGLIDDTLDSSEYRVPCLGNIPGLGWLFKSVSRAGEKTDLYIFLTPRIIENPLEAKDIYLEKRDQIDKIREGAIKMYQRPGSPDLDSGAEGD